MWVGAVATAALLVAGCAAGSRLIAGARQAAEPVSAPEYATVLAEVDAAIRAPFARLGSAGAAYAEAAGALRAGADRLDVTVAPEPVAATQEVLSGALRDLADVVEQAAGPGRPCPAASPVTAVLQSGAAGRVRDKADDLRRTDPAYAFGAFLPAAPALRNRRAPNGSRVKPFAADGAGELVVDGRGARADAAVSLVRAGEPVFTVYVRGGRRHTVAGIRPGTYQIFLASGTDWAARHKGFTRGCSFTRFDADFRYARAGTRWTVTLAGSPGGNATTSGVDPADFPVG